MTELTIPEAALLDARDKLHYPLHETRLRKFALAVVRFLFRFIMVMDIEGQANLPPDGAVIIASNHVSNLDAFPLQLALPRPLFFMGKAELFKNPLIHQFFRNLGGFPVYRGERDEWAIRHAGKLLRHGQVLGMFPEGTRSHGLGLKVAKTGAARLALSVNCPILPVAVDGCQHFFKTFPHRTRVRVKIGEPVWPNLDELPLALTDRVMFALARNLPEGLRGVYAETPRGF